MMRITTANPRPVIRARSRFAGLTLFAKIATNTRLSIPRTTSKTKSVAKPIQVCGSANQLKSMIFVFLNVPTQKGSLKRSSCLNKLHTQKTADGTAALPAVFHIYAYLP